MSLKDWLNWEVIWLIKVALEIGTALLACLWQNYEVDYSRQIKESRYIRAAILKDIINNRGFEAVWEFEKEVSYNNGIADALIELYGIELRKEIYERFCIGLLNESFVQHYFRILYNEIEETEARTCRMIGLRFPRQQVVGPG